MAELAIAGIVAAQRWHLISSSRAVGFQIALLGLAYASMGVLIASRRAENRIGWLFLVIGVSAAASALATALSTDAPLGPHALFGADIGSWLNQFVWAPAWISIPTFVLLLFPDGRLPSRRFRLIGWLAALGIGGAVVGGMLSPDNSSTPGFRNPLVVLPKSVDLLSVLSLGLVAVAGIGSIVGLVVRYRRSRGDEREQLKWFVFAGVATAVLYVGLTAEVKAGALQALGFIAIPLLPAATAVAVLRYRLYDIDRIISRTVTYTLVTALVAGVYVLVVLVPTTVLGHGHTPPWLVAVGTILAAAAFRPIRRRIQNAIDRRFNRSRYDAAWAIEAFSARLRDEVDIDELTNDLQALVRRTMEPEHISVWLRST